MMKQTIKKAAVLAACFALVFTMIPAAGMEAADAAAPAKAADLFPHFAKQSAEDGAMKNAVVVMFEGDDSMTKREAKLALSADEGSVGDAEVEKLWNIEAEEDGPKDGETATVALVKSDRLPTGKLVKTLRKNKNVKYAEPNYRIHASSVTNDPYSDRQWSMQDGENTPNVSYQWNTRGVKETDAIVAVVDTGVDYTHEELKDSMWENEHAPKLKGEHGYDFVNGDLYPMDDNGHGTHCAGIIGARGNNETGISGVCQNVRIMALKILDAEGGSYLSHEIAAYNYINKALDLGEPIKAINNSWGGGEESRIMDELIEIVGKKGAVSCFAAGNESANLDEEPAYPVSRNSLYSLSVAATNEKGKLASYSNYGESVNVAAPGTDILSTVPYNVYNPSLYGEDQAALSQQFNDFEGDETWGVPEADGVFLNGEAYDAERDDQEISWGVEEGGFGETGKCLRITANKMKAGDILCFPLPYTIGEDANLTPRFSIMGKASGPESSNPMLGMSLFGIVDLEQGSALDVNTIGQYFAVGGVISGEGEVWDHLVNTPEQAIEGMSDYDGTNRDRMAVVLLYANDAGNYTLDLDDFGLSDEMLLDEEAFGKYEYMSGTSMACPYVAGAVALKAEELGEQAGAEEVAGEIAAAAKDPVEGEEYDKNHRNLVWIGPDGMLDFRKRQEALSLRLGNITVDPKANTLTISCTGADPEDAALQVKFRDSIYGGTFRTAEIKETTRTSITVENYGFINNIMDVRVTATGSKKAERRYEYLVDGKRAFAEAPLDSDLEITSPNTTDGRRIYTAGLQSIEMQDPKNPDNSDTIATVNPKKIFPNVKENPLSAYGNGMLFKSLTFMNGAVYSVVEYGEREPIEESEEEEFFFSRLRKEKYSVDLGDDDDDGLTDEGFSIYSGEYKLVRAKTSGGKCEDLGKLPADLELTEDYTVASYNGKLYFMGGNSMKKGEKGLTDRVYVYDPSKAKGKRWSKGPKLPEKRAGGKALQAGNRLIYTLGYSEEQSGYELEEQECPKNLIFDGKNWTWSAERLEPYQDAEVVPCAGEEYLNYQADVGLAKGGLVYVGLPARDYGDTFTYNTAKDRFADTGYHLDPKFEVTSAVSAIVGNRIYTMIDEESLCTANVASGVVNVKATKKGKGTIKGAGAYMPGNNATIKVTAAKGYRIKSIKAGGKKIKVKAKQRKKTFQLKKLLTDKKVSVVFAKRK